MVEKPIITKEMMKGGGDWYMDGNGATTVSAIRSWLLQARDAHEGTFLLTR